MLTRRWFALLLQRAGFLYLTVSWLVLMCVPQGKGVVFLPQFVQVPVDLGLALISASLIIDLWLMARPSQPHAEAPR
jgi:hypothetical protein